MGMQRWRATTQEKRLIAIGRTVVGDLRPHIAVAPSVGRLSQKPTIISPSASAQLGMDALVLQPDKPG